MFVRMIKNSPASIVLVASVLAVSFVCKAEAQQLDDPTRGEISDQIDFSELFQQGADNSEIGEAPELRFGGVLTKSKHALTELLGQDSGDAWNSVIHYFAKSDFILTAVYSYRNFTKNELLHRLNLKQTEWAQHVRGIGQEMSDFGKTLVEDARFGSALHNVITCRFQVTTFMYLKTMADTFKGAIKADPILQESVLSGSKVLQAYLESHDLLDLKAA